MNGQEEFHDVEVALGNIHEKQLDPKAFAAIHRNLMEEAAKLERKERLARVMKRSMWGLAGASALFLFVFIGLSMSGPLGSSNSEMAKVKDDAGVKSGHNQENSISGIMILPSVEDILANAGIEYKGAKPDEGNVFHQNLNGVSPAIYQLSDGELAVYVYEDEVARDYALGRFENITASMELAEHTVFQVRNILMFYVGENEDIREKISQRVNSLNKNDENGYQQSTGLGEHDILLDDLYVPISYRKEQVTFERRIEGNFTIVDIFEKGTGELLYTFGESQGNGDLKEIFRQVDKGYTTVRLSATVDIDRGNRLIRDIINPAVDYDPEPAKMEGPTDETVLDGPRTSAQYPAEEAEIYLYQWVVFGKDDQRTINEGYVVGVAKKDQ